MANSNYNNPNYNIKPNANPNQFELGNDELSIYASDVESIKEIKGLQTTLKNLTIMHCSKLSTVKGIENLIELIELNLSSNKIIDIVDLNFLSKLRILNLSCNLITSIPNFNRLMSLEILNLSHNRIYDIQNLKSVYLNLVE